MGDSYSASLCLYMDDVRICARTAGVICSQSVIIVRVSRKSRNASTCRVADIQIVVSKHVINKRRVRSHIQSVTCRLAYTAPLGREAGGSYLTCITCTRSRRWRHSRRSSSSSSGRCGSCGCRCRRWCSTRQRYVTLCADGCAANAVAEVLSKAGIVLLHACCSRGVAASQRTVDHIKTALTFVQSKLEVGSATPGEVLSAPFDVEDAVGRISTNRSEDPKPSVQRIKIVPVRENGVVVQSPRQAHVAKASVRG